MLRAEPETVMQISDAEAQGQLLALVRRAEAGEEVVLTHEGRAFGVIAPFERPQTPDDRRASSERS